MVLNTTISILFRAVLFVIQTSYHLLHTMHQQLTSFPLHYLLDLQTCLLKHPLSNLLPECCSMAWEVKPHGYVEVTVTVILMMMK